MAMRDAQQNSSFAQYNPLSQRTRSKDPDQGEWLFTYDALGEVYKQTDVRNVVSTTTARDSLGRAVARTEVPLGTTGENLLKEWKFDSATNGIGQLASTSLWRGTGQNLPVDTSTVNWSESYAYDSASRLNLTTTVFHEVSSTTLNTSTSYDGYGRLYSHTYPSNLQVSTLYGPHGHPGALANPSPIQFIGKRTTWMLGVK
jgi:YD repeat-containing protein